jgi:ribosomal protein S1
MTVPRVLGFVVLPLWLAAASLAVASPPQDPTEKKVEEPKPDTFFAGTVVEFSAEKIAVSRVNLGKMEKRVFRVTPDTKCEGKLAKKARVTVQYVTTDDGETAELIIVRAPQKRTQK